MTDRYYMSAEEIKQSDWKHRVKNEDYSKLNLDRVADAVNEQMRKDQGLTPEEFYRKQK